MIAVPTLGLEEIDVPLPLEETHRDINEGVSYLLPIAPFQNGSVSSLSIDGNLETIAFRIDTEAPVFELAGIFRDLLRQQGYTELFHCHDRECGGFAFRLDLDLVAAPAMYVDLRNFHYVAAEKLGEVTVYAAVMVSRSTTTAFAQIDIASTHSVGQSTSITPLSQIQTSNLEVNDTTNDVVFQLENYGHAILNTLEFASGSSQLEEQSYSQLDRLAEYLNDNLDAQIILVGHTDTIGSRDNNFEISQQRAEAVMLRLVEAHNIDSARLSAEGIGFLAPLSTNTSHDGRLLNRRVEAVLITNQ